MAPISTMLRESPDGVLIDIRVIPRARKTELAGTRQNALLIRLAAPPVDDAANDELIRFLGQTLDVPARAIRIVGGQKARQKTVSVAGCRVEDVRSRLGL